MSDKRVVIFGWAHRVHTQRWAAGMASRGYEIKLISLGGDTGESELHEKVSTVAFPHTGKSAYLRRLNQAAREARKFRPHLVHAHYAAGFGLWALRSNFHPTVVSVWGADVIDFPSNRIYKSLIKRILKNADWITATSQYLQNVCLDILPGAIKKSTVVPFGVEIPPEIAPLPPEKPFRICFVKAHTPKYAPDLLLEAVALAKKEIPDIQLSIAGEGEMTETLREMSKALGLQDNVTFAGFVDHAKIYDFIREHHVMVMPSVMASESFGVAVLEAAACGRPSIASHIGGVPEVIIDGQTGTLVPPRHERALAEEIIHLAKDYALVEKLGHGAYEFVKKKYPWEKSLDLMSEIYERLING